MRTVPAFPPRILGENGRIGALFAPTSPGCPDGSTRVDTARRASEFAVLCSAGECLLAGRGLLAGDRGLDLIHVDIAHGLNQLLEALLRQGARLGVEDDAVADRHEGGDG